MHRATAARSAIVTLALVATLAAAAPPAGGAALYTARKVVGRLSNVAAFTFAPNGRIYYAERGTGKIRIWDPVAKTKSLFFAITKVVNNLNTELGLLGLAFHPSYPAKPYLYAYVTRVVGGAYRIQIVRIEDTGANGTGDAMKVVWTDTNVTAGGWHVGGRIMFGPDDMFYVVIGERGEPRLAQDMTSYRGKILRMELNGTDDGFVVPADNPIGGSYVYTYGIRNSYGFDFDPSTDNLWETENGPECNDELNLVEAGGNQAWGPNAVCSSPPDPPKNTNRDGPLPRNLPQYYWTPTIAPTGAAFCDSCDLDAGAEGKLFFGAFNDGKVRMIALTGDRLGVSARTVVYTHDRRVLSMETSPLTDQIYFADGQAIYRLAMPA